MQWEKGLEIMPTAQVNGQTVVLENIRDFRYHDRAIVSEDYVDRTFDVNNLSGAWFLCMPFSRHKGVAHCFVTFDFQDQDPVVLSIEARKKPGEVWSPLKGMVRSYPLMYVWANETDETVRRVMVLRKEVHMFPLFAPQEILSDFFLQMAQETADLVTHPKYYNTVLRNCTNKLARSINKVRPGTVPFDKARLFPGYAPQLLHRLRYIPHDDPVEQIMERYKIGEHVRELYEQPDFSQQLRNQLAASV